MRPALRTIIGVVAIALVMPPGASAANINTVTGGVAPVGPGSANDPLPIGVKFALKSRNESSENRPLPTKTYVLGVEGVQANPGAFPSCSIKKLRVRRGPPATCGRSQIGRGIVRGAAGIVEDQTMAESVPCNLRLRVYNMGSGMALRLDGDPPLPGSFRSTKIGCPVPIHVAIPAPFRRIVIDGQPSTEMRFTVPRLLMRPLAGWNSGLMVVDATVDRLVSESGKGYFAATGCSGGTRALNVGFVDINGRRADASADPRC